MLKCHTLCPNFTELPMYIPRSVTENRKNSFYVRMRRPWNSLSEDLVKMPPVSTVLKSFEKVLENRTY